MKILQINSVCGTGSTGRIAANIHKKLINLGHESFIAYGRGSNNGVDNTIRIGSSFENFIHLLSTRLFDNHGFSSKIATKRFVKKIKQLEPDVIHLHNLHGYYIHIEVLFKYLSKSNIPVVWTLHDCWAFTGHCSYFDYVGCEKWKIKCNACPQKRNYPSSFLMDRSRENFKKKKAAFTSLSNLKIITPSNWLASLVKQSFLSNNSVEIINNGVDLDIFRPRVSEFRETHKLNNKFMILGVANVWDFRKGINCFIDLSTKLVSDEILVLVGISPRQTKKLPENIISISRTESIIKLSEIYSSADVFVNPTLEDNFPTTNLEALACGSPVITFNTGGSIEALDANTGRVLRHNTVIELYDTIKEIKNLGKKFFSRNCRNRAKNFYNMNHRFSDYIDLYKKIVS
jgi:putative colanic acid biosynthesis glycosyltransferase